MYLRRLKKYLIIVGVLLGILILIGGVSRMNINKEEYRQNFAVEPGTVLRVFNKNGDIDVSGWECDFIEVVAIKKINWLTRLLKEPKVEVETGEEIVVRTLYSSAICQAIPVQYRITVPKGVLVTHVESSTGKIYVADVSGDLNAITSTGEIRINQVIGLVKAMTSTGKVSVADVSGDLDAKTSAGEIQIHKVNGFVKAVTSCGKINITEVGGLFGARTNSGAISVEVPAFYENLEIRSSNGNITAFISPKVTARLEVRTSSGKIDYTGLPLTVSQSSKTQLMGKFGEGGGLIKINTSNGSINLKKL